MNRTIILILLVIFLLIGVDFVVKHRASHQGIGGASVDTCENPYPELGVLTLNDQGEYDLSFQIGEGADSYRDAFHFTSCEGFLKIPSSEIAGLEKGRYARWIDFVSRTSDGDPSNDIVINEEVPLE